MKVLIIDDQIDNIKSLEATLRLNYKDLEVICATNGETGVELSITEIPDLIFLDILMPGMDGFKVCTNLKTIKTTQHIPIIMVSAIANRIESRVQALNSFADAVISKPYDSEELFAQVNLLLRIKKAEDKIRTYNQELEKLVELKTRDLTNINKELEEQIHFKETAQKTIVAQNKDLKKIIDSLPSLMFILDQDFQLIDSNQKVSEYFNYTASEDLDGLKSEIINTPIQIGIENNLIFDEIDNPLVKNTFDRERKKNNGSKYSFEFNYLNKKNYIFEFHHEYIFLEDKEVLLFFLDEVSEKRTLENAYVESQRLSAIGEMTSSIAHDFNNSLQSILSNLEIAKIVSKGNIKLLKYLKTIEKTSVDAAERVKTLQQFSKKTSSVQNYRVLKINEVINDAIMEIEPFLTSCVQMDGINIKVINDIPKDIFIEGNVGQLRSAFFNLIKNSCEAMPNGGTIHFVSKIELGKLIINISDNGLGMDQETIKRVFQPFFSTKGFEVGRGLGMNSVQNIITEHNGLILIEKSEPNKGTIIRIELPISKKKFSEIPELPEILPEEKSILLVEDDEELRKTVSEMLQLLGHNVNAAANGKIALKLINENTYDLIISDVGMPVMTGTELARIVQNSDGVKPKFILLTGWGDSIEKEIEGIDIISDILSKPISMQKLNMAISNLYQSISYK